MGDPILIEVFFAKKVGCAEEATADDCGICYIIYI